MSPIVQFDPASLSIWTCTGSLGEAEAALAQSAMNAAASGGDPLAALAGLDADDPLRTRLLWLASCVWHEKRHFFDTLLTNYGALRFRNLFTLGMNLEVAIEDLARRGEPVWFPIEVYDNPIRRRLLGIAEPSAELRRIARHARTMKAYVAQIDAAASDGTRLIHVGAEAQLEGLAQVSQMHVIERRAGVDGVRRVTAAQVRQLPMDGPYRAIESVAGVLGCTRELSNGDIVVNPALAAALYITALCTRQLGAGTEPRRDLVSPWDRLARLLETLGTKAGRFDIGDEEAMALAEKAACQLWGRTALDEIEADIDLAEEKYHLVAEANAHRPQARVFAEYTALRRRALARVRSLGPASLLPRAFPAQWADQLQPWHVIATPEGAAAGDGGSTMVHGIKLDLPQQWNGLLASTVSWASVAPRPPSRPDTFELCDAAWYEMIENQGPLAQLGLTGRLGRAMVPPALTRAVARVEAEVPVRFDPMFDGPRPRSPQECADEALTFARWSGRSQFVCDVTGDTIAPEDAAVLTPWELRRSPLVERVRERLDFAGYLLATNWSDWIVRRDLLA